MAIAPAPERLRVAQVELAEAKSLGASNGFRGLSDAEDPSMPHANRRSRHIEVYETTPTPTTKGADLHLPTLGAVARLVAPTLGGAFLGGLLIPAWVVGGIVGGAIGLLVGAARDREVANTTR